MMRPSEATSLIRPAVLVVVVVVLETACPWANEPASKTAEMASGRVNLRVNIGVGFGCEVIGVNTVVPRPAKNSRVAGHAAPSNTVASTTKCGATAVIDGVKSPSNPFDYRALLRAAVLEGIGFGSARPVWKSTLALPVFPGAPVEPQIGLGVSELFPSPCLELVQGDGQIDYQVRAPEGAP